MNKIFIYIVLLLIYSCKKDEGDDSFQEIDQRIIMNLDSIYMYAQEIYLWNDQLPNKNLFNTERFSSAVDDEISLYEKEIFEMTRFAINPLNSLPYEYNVQNPTIPKYSKIIGRNITDFVSDWYNPAANLEYSFGFSIRYEENKVYIVLVSPNSPAGRAGLNRGDRLISVNGKEIIDFEAVKEMWEEAMESSFIKIEVSDVSGKIREVRMSSSSYETNPVHKHLIINRGTENLGYVAYNSFTDEENTDKYLRSVFSNFAQNKVTELVIDMRYNGGGYQNTVKFLANILAPRETEGKLMFSEHYNSKMQQGKADILKNQIIYDEFNLPIYIDGHFATLADIDYSINANSVQFQPQDILTELNKIYFIVSDLTASASELLISVLKPYMNVEIIGVSTDGRSTVRTYGKPVGSFDIAIGGHKMYLPLYQTRNGLGEGEFYEGLLADYCTFDDPTYDFGDIRDPALQHILNDKQGEKKLKMDSHLQKIVNRRIYLLDLPTKGNIKAISELKLKKR